MHKKTQNLNLFNFMQNVKHFVVIFYHREKKKKNCFLFSKNTFILDVVYSSRY